MTNHPYEQAARNYCTRIGHDPDSEVPCPHPMGLAIPFTKPAWQLAAEKLMDLSHMLSAIHDAATAQAEVTDAQQVQ